MDHQEQAEYWIPTPKQLEMIDAAIREFESGEGMTLDEAKAEVARQIEQEACAACYF